MNPVLILTHNNLELTKKCVASVKAQDVPTSLYIIDNGSWDETPEWAPVNSDWYDNFSPQIGVSAGWNVGLEGFFADGEGHVLVVNNDTILPTHFYRQLLSCKIPFVTGASVKTMEEMLAPREYDAPYPGPDFSAFLIRRSAWDLVGKFDERMVHYASDNDWHVRAHRKGLELLNSGVAFYHERSSTLNKAGAREKAKLKERANADTDIFKEIYGCKPWEPGYADLVNK